MSAPNPATTLYVDLETFSPVDLRKKPEPPYGTHARAGRITHFAYALGDEPAQVSTDPAPVEERLKQATALVCHNISYDISCMRDCAGRGNLRELVDELVVPDDSPVEPLCSMGMAALLNMPRSLGNLVKFLKVGEKQEYDFQASHTKGGDLFADESKLEEYARNDVDITRKAFLKLIPYIKPVSEWDIMCQHNRVNARGMYVDRQLLTLGLNKQRDELTRLNANFRRQFGFAPSNTHAMLKWIQRNGHPDLTSVAQDILEGLRDKTRSAGVREIIDLRLQLNNGELKKLESIERHVNGDPEGRLRHAYRYCGAHTGRFTSKGAQMHNMKRPPKEELDAQGNKVEKPLIARQMMRATPGKKLFISDFSQIELRVNLWFCDHAEAVKVLHDGDDLYMELARSIFGRDADKEKRFLSKVAALAMQYGGRPRTVARSLGISESLSQTIYDGFHKRFPGFARVAKEFEAAFNHAISQKRRVPIAGGKAFLEGRGQSLFMELPDGRAIRYAFVSTDDPYLLFKHGQPGKHQTMVRSGWTLVENFAQSYSRSFLTEAMVRFGKHPVPTVVAHTHDELISEVPMDFTDEAELHAMMLPTDTPDGLYVDAESGFATTFADK